MYAGATATAPFWYVCLWAGPVPRTSAHRQIHRSPLLHSRHPRSRLWNCARLMAPPDGSANLNLLLAGMAVAARTGFEMPNALKIAQKTYVNVNIHKAEHSSVLEKLAVLPDSCAASADCLQAQRSYYEKEGVFSPAMIDGIISGLQSFNDRTLRADIGNDQEKILELVHSFFHCG